MKRLSVADLPCIQEFMKFHFKVKVFEDQNLTKFRGTATVSFWNINCNYIWTSKLQAFKPPTEKNPLVIFTNKNRETRFEIKMT